MKRRGRRRKRNRGKGEKEEEDDYSRVCQMRKRRAYLRNIKISKMQV